MQYFEFDKLLENAEKSIYALKSGYPQRSIIYYGSYGKRKKDLLNVIEEKVDLQNVLYVHIEVDTKRSFLQQIFKHSELLIDGMSTDEKATGISQIFNSTYNSNDLTDLFGQMGKMAVEVGVSICFFIDEIQNMKENEMEALIIATHRISQLRLPIMVYGTGISKVLKMFGNVKAYSESLFKFVSVAELSDESARTFIPKSTKVMSQNS